MAENQYLTPAQKLLQQNNRDAMKRNVQIAYSNLTPDKLTNFNDISLKYPGMSKDLVMAMVNSGLNSSTPGIDKITSYDGIAQLKRDARNVDNIKATVEKKRGFIGEISDAVKNVVWDPFKGVSRVGFAGLRSIYDFATVMTRDLTQGVPTQQLIKDFTQGIAGESTQLGQLVRNWSNQGSGFFITPETKVGKAQAKAMGAYGKIYGESFTIGRYTAKSLGQGPDTTAYKIMSGLVDATLNIALDPTTYLGPGAATKVLGKGKQFTKMKDAVRAGGFKPNSEIIDEVTKLAEESDLLSPAVRKRTANRYNKKVLEAQEQNAHIVRAEARNAKKLLATEEQVYFGAGVDNATLDPANVANWFVTHPKVASGEMTSAVDKLSADFTNTGGFFDGWFLFDEIPEAGKISVGVHKLDEFVVTGKENYKFKLYDLADDFADAPKNVRDAEIAKRASLMARIEETAADFTQSPATRQAMDDLYRGLSDEGKSFDGFMFKGYVEDSMVPMAELIAKASQFKNPEAMSVLNDMINEIWKVDGFANVRAIYGETGGFSIVNKGVDKISARPAQVAMAAAEVADPTNLGPNMLKFLGSLEEPTVKLERTRAAAARAEQTLKDYDQTTKEVSLWRELVDNDPELLQKVLNDPDSVGLDKFLNLKVNKEDTVIEYLRHQVGLTEEYAGELGTDFSKPLQYLLGRNFQEIAKVIADETDAYKIHNYFGKKLDADMVKNLTDAKSADDVFKAFLTHLGAENTDPNIFRSMSLRAQAGKLTANPLGRLVDPVSLVPFKMAETLERSYNRFFVRSTALNLGDTTGLVNGVENWISSTGVKASIGKGAQEKLIQDTSRALFNAGSNQERAAIVEGMTVQLNELIGKRLGLDGDDLKTLKDSVRLSNTDKNIKTSYSVNHIAEDTVPAVIFNGTESVPLPSAMHEFQLLNNFVYLPDTKEVARTIMNFEKNKIIHGAKAAKVLAEEAGDVWRTAQLVFRVSYVLRNIAEMQMRQFLSGHANVLSHPLQFTAMVMANPNGNAVQKLAARSARYQTDLTGTAFKSDEAEGEFLEAWREAQTFYHRSESVSDYRINKNSEIFKYYRVTGPESDDYFKGLAFTLNRFASDRLNPDIAKLVINNADEPTKRAFVDGLIKNYDKPDNIIREYVTGAFEKNPSIKQIFLKNPELSGAADNIDANKVYTFFFDEAQEHTLASQIRSVAGTGPRSHVVLDIIANGRASFTDDSGKLVTISTPWLDGPKTSRELVALEKKFEAQLKNVFKPEDLVNSRVLTAREVTSGVGGTKAITQAVDKFFEFATRLESKMNFGPEYTMAYWDHVGKYARMLSTEDLKYVQRTAQQNLAPISKQVNGRVITVGRKHATLRVIETELKKRLKNPEYGAGSTTKWQTIHQMSAREASKYTKDLFYDAAKQRQWANAWRLVAPFAQAQANTVSTWNKLFWGNPLPAYKFGKAYSAATQEGSNVVYDVAGMAYDDNQGFIYRDQATGEERFKMPLVGNLIGALAGKNIDAASAMQITAPVQSLNLAFGQVNPLVPGIGPAGQAMFAVTGSNAKFGPVYEVLRDIVTPFGQPTKLGDIVFPSWLNKMVAFGTADTASVERGVKDWAAQLASTGKYGDNPFANDAERTRLFNDARAMSKSVGLLTAFFQSISPATPSDEVVAKIKDPKNKVQFMTMTMLYDAWDKISKSNPGDYGKSVMQFAEQFGANNLMIALGGTTSAVRGTDDAWNFLNNNPGAADKFARNPGDVVPYFFPGGNFSLKYNNWQRKTGARRALSTNELANEAEGMIYAMLKDQIEEEQIAGGYSDFWYQSKIAELDKNFGGRPADFITTNIGTEKIGRIGEALQDPALKQSPVYEETAQFFEKFTEFQGVLNEIGVSNYASLKGSNGYATMARDELITLAETLMAQNPAFSRMYYGVFASQLEG